jgi:hypothetical protein
MGEPSKGFCKACGESITFLVTKNGKKMPVDSLSANGNDGILDPTRGHYPHWGSCKESDKMNKIIQEDRKKKEESHGH